MFCVINSISVVLLSVYWWSCLFPQWVRNPEIPPWCGDWTSSASSCSTLVNLRPPTHERLCSTSTSCGTYIPPKLTRPLWTWPQINVCLERFISWKKKKNSINQKSFHLQCRNCSFSKKGWIIHEGLYGCAQNAPWLPIILWIIKPFLTQLNVCSLAQCFWRPHGSHFVIMFLPVVSKTVCVIGRNEKDNQGENMFMRCVSELVIESREVWWGHASEITDSLFLYFTTSPNS